jgi:hypothetical protein
MRRAEFRLDDFEVDDVLLLLLTNADLTVQTAHGCGSVLTGKRSSLEDKREHP